jgi:hypothetical protein
MMVALRGNRPIAACGMGRYPLAFFHILSYPLDSPWSFFPNLALVVVFWVFYSFFQAQHTASQKRCGFFYSSIDVDIGFLEWTRLETILLFLDFTVTYSALRANCSNNEKILLQ